MIIRSDQGHLENVARQATITPFEISILNSQQDSRDNAGGK